MPYPEGLGLWNANTGEPIVSLPYPGSANEAAYSPNRKRLEVGGIDSGRLYFLGIDELIAIAEARLTRTLTTEECQKYLHLAQCP